MRVTFHGVRGSVPTPGPSTVRYGGNTACVNAEQWAATHAPAMQMVVARERLTLEIASG
jgi:hypothetical protein